MEQRNTGLSNTGLNRRSVLTLGGGLLGLAAGASLWPMKSVAAAPAVLAPASLSPEEALQRLLEGNQRFTQHHLQHPDQSESRVLELTRRNIPLLQCSAVPTRG